MLTKVLVKNYRSIPSLEVEVSKRLNIIIAPNASGKTNFLEAIYYATYGTSFRALSNNSEVIRKNESFAKISIVNGVHNIESIITLSGDKLLRKFTLNGKRISISKIGIKFPVILFAPNSVDLISGGPSVRRDDLDTFLSLTSEEYFNSLKRYRAILKNRNALLKNIRENNSGRKELSVWTAQLIEAANILFCHRKDFFLKISDFISQSSKKIYKKMENLDLVYAPNVTSTDSSFEAALNQKYEKNIEKEIIVGKTLYGVHKDDYAAVKGNQHLRFFGSRGEQRIGAFIIKIAFKEYLEKTTQNQSILLLDDVMSELDEQHRDNLSSYLMENDIQFILTSADARELPPELLNAGSRIIL